MVRPLIVALYQAVLVYSFGKNLTPEQSLQEDMTLDPVDFITKYGNKAERHKVTTADGYLLEIHRMLPAQGNLSKRHPAFLMHGLGSSSFDWIILGPGKSLPHLLSAEGFEVWLGNARGNLYGTKHIRLNTNGSKFWNFSWHEIGIYDLPAIIDYILNITESKSLHYIGHSQGTTAFFVMCSMKPDYNKKIQTMNALAPVAFMSHLKSLSKHFAGMTPLLEAILFLTGVHEIPKVPVKKFRYAICNEKSSVSEICDSILFLIGGTNMALWNKTLVPLIASHAPAGFSTKQVVHYSQEIKSGKFRQFDYSVQNQLVYGSSEPPEYQLLKVIAPVALHWSDGDLLSHPTDVHELSMKLSNVILDRQVPFTNFTHIDFLWAIDAKKYVYDTIIEVITTHDDLDIKNKEF